MQQFEVDLGGASGGGVLSFATLEAAQNWAAQENARWEWIRTLSPERRQGPIEAAFSAVRSARKAIDRAVQLSANASQGNSSDFESSLQTAREQLRIAYGRLRLPLPDSTAAKRIDALAAMPGGTPTAGGYLHATLATPETLVSPSAPGLDFATLRGMMWAVVERPGSDAPLAEAYSAAASAFDSLQQRASASIGTADMRIADGTNAIENLKVQFDRLFSSHESQLKAAIDSNKVKFTEQLSTHSGTLAGLEATFKEKLALRAPATYWSKRMWRHTAGAIVGGIGTALAIVAVVLALILYAGQLAPPKGQDGLPDVWRLGTLVLAGIFTVWFVRLLVRIFLSQLHLAQDAAERATMVTTYLSLVEGGDLSDDDRKLILQTLFRPASDGIVKDEGLPPSIHEIFTRNK